MKYLNGTSKVSVSRWWIFIWVFPNIVGIVGFHRTPPTAASEKLNLLFYWEFLKVALVRIHIGFAFWFLTRNLNWEYHKFLEFQTLSEMSIKEIGMIYAELMTTLRIFKGTVNMNWNSFKKYKMQVVLFCVSLPGSWSLAQFFKYF